MYTILRLVAPRLYLVFAERRRARLVALERGLWRHRHGAAAQRIAVARHGVEIEIMEVRHRLGLPLMPPRAASVGRRLEVLS
jgi:hypothetical protein